MRWDHPQRGRRLPGDFIPVAESTGLIVPMGHWLLDRACRDARSLQEETECFDLHLAVNLSARQLEDPTLVVHVASALEASRLRPELLTLEITESVFMANPERSVEMLERLKDLGVKLSIDDFGTGYSSLSYLQRLPVDELKIDRVFVAQDGVEASSLVATIVRMADDFGLQTVAEGIDDARADGATPPSRMCSGPRIPVRPARRACPGTSARGASSAVLFDRLR